MYVTGIVIGNTITVAYLTDRRFVPTDVRLTCLKLVNLANFQSKEKPNVDDVLGIYTNPAGAQYAVAQVVS